MKRSARRWWLGLVSTVVLCAGTVSRDGSTPVAAASSGPAATIRRYYEALRDMKVEAVRGTLAPDYSYDRSDAPAFDPMNPFESPLGLTYRSLFFRIEALTTAGKTATAIVTTVFEAVLSPNLLLVGGTPVLGNSREVLELERRSGEWKLTAVRPVRTRYRSLLITELPPEGALLGLVTTLFDMTVNGQTSVRVPPGAPLTLAGKSRSTSLVIGVIGAFSLFTLARQELEVDPEEPLQVQKWALPLQAPDKPGRYLAYALSVVVLPGTETGSFPFLTGDLVTLPVTVVSPG
jgi:hypothetical protein